MTKATAPHPEPTAGTNYDIFLVPHSKTPAKNTLYAALLDADWRFDAHYSLWHTPEASTFQAFGRLEYDPDLTWARVQPPNPNRGDQRAEPILTMWRAASGEWHLEAADA